MKVIVAGSRYVDSYNTVLHACNASGYDFSCVVSGGARGVDRLGELYAEEYHIPVIKFLPDWSLGKLAGKLRNIQMADYADALLAVWDGISPGTAHMIAYMYSLGKPVKIIKTGDLYWK